MNLFERKFQIEPVQGGGFVLTVEQQMAAFRPNRPLPDVYAFTNKADLLRFLEEHAWPKKTGALPEGEPVVRIGTPTLEEALEHANAGLETLAPYGLDQPTPRVSFGADTPLAGIETEAGNV